MSTETVRRQVLAILESNGLRWSEQKEGLAMRFSSAMVWLSFLEVGRQTVISLRSPILREVDMESHGVALFRRLNELNCDSHFGKWAVYRTGLVSLEYDLLADGLQEDELMTVVTMLARLADRQDDLLQGEFGGLRSFD